MSASINWPEHLRVLHRLLDTDVFRFRSKESVRISVYFGVTTQKWTISSSYFGSQFLDDDELSEQLAKFDALELVSTS